MKTLQSFYHFTRIVTTRKLSSEEDSLGLDLFASNDIKQECMYLPFCIVKHLVILLNELQIHIWAASCSHMMQAGHSFKGTLMSQRLVRENDSDEHYTVPVNFDCSQEILDILVKAIYARKIDLTADNVKDILMLADFLRASPQSTVESNPKCRSVQAEVITGCLSVLLLIFLCAQSICTLLQHPYDNILAGWLVDQNSITAHQSRNPGWRAYAHVQNWAAISLCWADRWRNCFCCKKRT